VKRVCIVSGIETMHGLYNVVHNGDIPDKGGPLSHSRKPNYDFHGPCWRHRLFLKRLAVVENHSICIVALRHAKPVLGSRLPVILLCKQGAFWVGESWTDRDGVI
jgi:hypothetical protein